VTEGQRTSLRVRSTGSSWVMGTRYRAPPPPAIRGTEGTCGPATRRRTATPLDLPDLRG